MPSFDPKVITYELRQYLDESPAVNSPSLTAHQKLSQLTKQQFEVLSTDVYDEIMRRKMNSPKSEILLRTCLPVRDEFHPERNQARQKLATLPTARFKVLSYDIYFELLRRYPEFNEENEGGQLLSMILRDLCFI